jgi:hypothetical protein
MEFEAINREVELSKLSKEELEELWRSAKLQDQLHTAPGSKA